MNAEQEQVWERLNQVNQSVTVVTFVGNGVATKFNSGWLSNCRIARITVDDVARSEFRDFRIEHNDVIFYKPPTAGHKVKVEVYL